MAYALTDLYSSRQAELVQILKSREFASDGDWKATIEDAKVLTEEIGFKTGRYKACTSIRTIVAKGAKHKATPAATLLAGAGGTVPKAPGTLLGADLTNRIAALDTLRSLWLLKERGSHKLWVLSLATGYADWPVAALSGKSMDALASIVNEKRTRFSSSDCKHLSHATQEGLKWIHAAMIIAAAPDKAKHKAILKRWFADANTSDDDLNAAAGTLLAGLKKMSITIKSTFLLLTDMPKDRASPDSADTNAFVFKDEKVSVIYIEGAFFKDGDTWKGLKNWTRIIVHELSHRDGKTEDHRYRHNPAGLKPVAATNFSATQALANADSWAIFCMDCAGYMTKSDYKKVKVD